MAVSISFRLLLAILITVLPFDSLVIRPACLCSAKSDQSANSCCLIRKADEAASQLELNGAPSKSKVRNTCCQSKVEVTRSGSYPISSYSSGDCACGCQQAPEIDQLQSLMQSRDVEQKPVAISGYEPFVAVQLPNFSFAKADRRLSRPIALSSVERCALLCCWLI